MVKRLAIAPILVLLSAAACPAADPVTLVQDARTVTLANGIVSARIDKAGGHILSLSHKGMELLGPGRGYWSFAGSAWRGESVSRFGAGRSFAVRTDPAANGGARAEVSCRFEYDGQAGTLPLDVDIRYALARGDSGLYAYAVWRHRPGQPSLSLGEARMVLKLDGGIFDFLAVDRDRRRAMPAGRDWDAGQPLNLAEARRLTTGIRKGEVEHKYDYSAILADVPAYGWSSTARRVGVWMMNPSMEYVSGGPTKVELTGHLDANRGGLPTLLNMWQGSHYGGGPIRLERDEEWTKVIGPFLIYCNDGGDHDALWADALVRAKAEAAAWPYAWVDDPHYPPASRRGTVAGRLVLRDPQAPAARAGGAWVGLTTAADWQRETKGYHCWTRADADGRFAVRHVRPGRYVLHAFVNGVLGEFALGAKKGSGAFSASAPANNPTSREKVPAPFFGVSVAAGQATDLGSLDWTPVRYGRQVWEIGVPDRSAAEFRHGDHYWQWGLYLKYPQEFPDDVDFVIGKSDWRRDWNYCQPPRIGPHGRGSDSTWRVRFDMPAAPAGRATLRIALCGWRGGGRLWASVNGREIGDTGTLDENGVMHRDGIRGRWREWSFAFDASLLKPGQNVLSLRSLGRNWTMGVLYDCLRLELDESRQAR